MKKKLLPILIILLCMGVPGAIWFMHTRAGGAKDSGSWLTLDTSALKYDANEDAYYTDEKLTLACELNPEKQITFLSCSVTNEFGDRVFYCEPLPDDTVTISDIGLFWGCNEVTFLCKNKWTQYEVTYDIHNSSPENVACCNIDNADNDGDGISNYWERIWGTDMDLADTDSDSIDDYKELYVLNTDPLNADANENGIADFNEDTDEDGIINEDEIKLYETNPFASDTDGDALSDYDELFTYLTDPLQADTDRDGLQDGNELAHGYDPLWPDSSFEITKSETSGAVTAGASICAGGSDAQSFSVTASEDVRFNEDIPGYLSDAFCFEVDSGNPGTVTISFSLQEAWSNNKAITPAICCFDEETQCFYPLDTYISNGVATAQTTHFSTYMLLDENAMYKPTEAIPGIITMESLPSAETDSNADGISDRDTYLLCDGQILSGTGQKVFGNATYEEVQANNDFDGDGLLNGQEVTIAYLDEIPTDAYNFNGHYYKIFDVGEYWDTARAKAESLGGYLCTITTPQEQTFVKNILPENGMGLYWLGSRLTENGWVWVTGEPFEYTHWGDSEPNNMQAVEAYVEMYSRAFKKKVRGDWNDASNAGAQYSDNFYVIENTGYIVEWNDNSPSMKYALIHSYPAISDTDGDGIPDGEDTAVFVRGLEGGILAKLTLLSQNNGGLKQGHSFLILHSYVNDLTLDVSSCYRGVDVLPGNIYSENTAPDTYTLESGTDIAIGSAGTSSADGNYNVDIVETVDLAVLGNWFHGGLWYNLEAHKFHVGYTKYAPNSCIDYALTLQDIAALETGMHLGNLTNTYHGIFYNCTHVAEELWNLVVPYDRRVDAKASASFELPYELAIDNTVPVLTCIASPFALKKYMEENFTDYYEYSMANFVPAIKN